MKGLSCSECPSIIISHLMDRAECLCVPRAPFEGRQVALATKLSSKSESKPSRLHNFVHLARPVVFTWPLPATVGLLSVQWDAAVVLGADAGG